MTRVVRGFGRCSGGWGKYLNNYDVHVSAVGVLVLIVMAVIMINSDHGKSRSWHKSVIMTSQNNQNLSSNDNYFRDYDVF